MGPWVFLNSPMRRTCRYTKKGWTHLTAVRYGDSVTYGSTGVSPTGHGHAFCTYPFGPDATLRRSTHNVAMRDIVLKHIISLRAEYPEIPDSEFEPVRLEPAFDQAFGTWKGKYQGKRPGGIRRGLGAEKDSPKPNQTGQTEKTGEGEVEGAGAALE